MNINRLMNEIWAADTQWTLGRDRVRGIYMYNAFTGVGVYADTVEDVARKVWLLIYATSDVEVLPPSHGMVKG